MLLKNITDIYEEQAAAKGDQDEWSYVWFVIYIKRNSAYIFNDNANIMHD